MFDSVSDKSAVRFILGLSAAIVAFLVWFIYFRQEAGHSDYEFVQYLPLVNASLNGLSAFFVVVGLFFISRRQIKAHIACMIMATMSSALFLVSYLLYHHFHGDTKFPKDVQGLIRPVYFFILISHIATSILVVPLVFSTLFFAVSKRFDKHRRIAKWTYPVWLYVSVTGILVYVILKRYVPNEIL